MRLPSDPVLLVTPPSSAARAPAPWDDPEAVPLIRVEAVAKRFGATPALDGVSLAIHEGEFFCLLGPSGCGKSTLLRMLAGFEAPDSGRITLDGADLAGVPPHRRPVNMMFQSYALFPHLSVAGNVAYGLKRAGLRRAEVAARVAEMVALVQLGGLEGRRPDQLSGGQRQRVALARALARRPRVLLLDEPLGALDKRLREETQAELKQVQAGLGTTFVVVTHDQEEAMSLSSRIAVMERGRVAQAGTPRALYERPRTRFVAGFLGDVNLFEGRVVGREGEAWRVEGGDAPGGFLVASADALEPGRAITLAVRPERLRLEPGDVRAPEPNRLPGEVTDLGYLGDTTTFRVRLASGAVLRVSRANAGGDDPAPIGRGERVTVRFAPGAAVILAG